MRYVMKQKLFSWADDYIIKTEAGDAVFRVDGRAFSLGSQLSFQDMAGNELAFIKQKLLSWGPTYQIYKADDLWATVRREFAIFKCSFEVALENGTDLEATGDLTDHEYTISRGDEPIAQISKDWFKWSDTYGVDIADGEDPVLILASTVVIDQACHADKD